MRKANVAVVAAVLTASFMTAGAWSAQQSEQPGSGFQPKAYFIMPLEKDPSRIVRLQTVVLRPALEPFTRHPAINGGRSRRRSTYTVRGQRSAR